MIGDGWQAQADREASAAGRATKRSSADGGGAVTALDASAVHRWRMRFSSGGSTCLAAADHAMTTATDAAAARGYEASATPLTRAQAANHRATWALLVTGSTVDAGDMDSSTFTAASNAVCDAGGNTRAETASNTASSRASLSHGGDGSSEAAGALAANATAAAAPPAMLQPAASMSASVSPAAHPSAHAEKQGNRAVMPADAMPASCPTAAERSRPTNTDRKLSSRDHVPPPDSALVTKSATTAPAMACACAGPAHSACKHNVTAVAPYPSASNAAACAHRTSGATIRMRPA